MKLNVLSLFDGMSCGRIALERAGFEVENYFASEIDEAAIAVAKHNYPGTKHVGDVTLLTSSSLPKIDLLIGGSPCQSISNLGDGTGLDGKSGLFFHYLRLLKETQPKYFLLENVVGNKKAIAQITELMQVEPVLFNSNLVSAQNRKRLYWTNIKFELPEDKKILASDILDKSYDSSLVLKGKGLNKLNRPRSRVVSETTQKIPCLLATQSTKPTDAVVIKHGEVYRYPTRKEMEKMQTIPEDYTSTVSYNKAAHMLGNGWTVDVIAHILKHMKFN